VDRDRVVTVDDTEIGVAERCGAVVCEGRRRLAAAASTAGERGDR